MLKIIIYLLSSVNKPILRPMKNPLIIFIKLVVVVIALSSCATNPSLTFSESKLNMQLAMAGGQLVRKGDDVMIVLPTDSCFEVNTARFTENCVPILRTMTDVVKSYGNVPITVTGYTDDVVSAQQARLLSRSQAESVVAYLWTQGISRQRMYAAGRGSKCAIASNATVAGSAYNRRVEITLRKP